METSGNTILITGGSTGIGFALARTFLERDNEVIVCARSEVNLRRAKEELPGLNIIRSDLSREDERVRLHDWVRSNFPRMNVLVNNAGIQRMIDLRKGTEDLLRNQQADEEDEIDINFKAYVYLAAHFIPDLLKRDKAAIVNCELRPWLRPHRLHAHLLRHQSGHSFLQHFPAAPTEGHLHPGLRGHPAHGRHQPGQGGKKKKGTDRSGYPARGGGQSDAGRPGEGRGRDRCGQGPWTKAGLEGELRPDLLPDERVNAQGCVERNGRGNEPHFRP